jgi:hypothetical protein
MVFPVKKVCEVQWVKKVDKVHPADPVQKVCQARREKKVTEADQESPAHKVHEV